MAVGFSRRIWYILAVVMYVACSSIAFASSSAPPGRKHRSIRAASAAAANISGSCSLFQGTWVSDQTYPLYKSSDCAAIIDPEFNCQGFGRPDSDYLKYRWKPLNCELPRFNGVDFLTRMRGKSIMYVGDSLGRNQWESMNCMIVSSTPRTTRTRIVRTDPLSTYSFLDYGVSVSFYRAPYLVDIDNVDGKRVLKLENISSNAKPWMTADVLSFNTGHWWVHKGALQGWDVMESGGKDYQDMDRLVALEKGMRTWANWVDTNIDSTRTSVFFQAISPTHYNPRAWKSSETKNCYGETVPIISDGSAYPGVYPNQQTVIAGVIKGMKKRAYLLDITTLSALRKDAHPSVYSGDLTPTQRANPDPRTADCSHWCLPGLPDTWNQLFYTALLY